MIFIDTSIDLTESKCYNSIIKTKTEVRNLNIIKDSDFRREIKQSPAQAYFFFGEEDYLKLHALSLAKQMICPDEALAMFNEMKLDALSYSPAALLDMITSLPMMADRKLITITGLDFLSMKPNELDALCAALSELSEYDYNTVIISAASDKFDPGYLPKRPSSTLSKLSEYMTCVQFEKSSPQRLISWVGKHYESRGAYADPSVCAFTIDYCGRDMFSLSQETDKISFYVLSQGRNTVTEQDVRYIGVNCAEYDAFAFTNAICDGRKDLALDILSEMKKKRTDPLIIMSEVSRTVCDQISVFALISDGLTHREIAKILNIHEYKVSLIAKSGRINNPQRLLNMCKRADIDIKSFLDGYTVLEKLICTM